MRWLVCVAVSGVLGLAGSVRAQERLFFEAELLSDERWGEVVSRDPVFEPGGYLSATADAGGATVTGGVAAGAGMGRQSIDVDVVTAIVAERARQIAMRAVADVLEESGGDALRRRYVQDLIEAATALLEDRAGMQRTHVERIASVLVRAVLAEALVEMRFPTRSTSIDPCHWRRAVFGEPSADQARRARDYHRREGAHLGRSERESSAEFCATAPFGAAVASAPADSLPDGAACELIARDRRGPTPAGAPEAQARLACSLRAARTGRTAMGVREWRPWLPPHDAPAPDGKVMRGYLVDLAYAWLSRSELFTTPVETPECPWEGGRYAGLCAFVDAAAGDSARDRRVAWLFGLDRVLDGLRLAQALRPFMRAPAEQRLRAFLGAYLERPDLGSFRDTAALTTAHWRGLAQTEASADYWLAMRSVSAQVKSFVQEHTADGTQASPAALKTAVQAAIRARTALCAGSAQEIGERPCAQAEWNAWLDGVADGSGLREAIVAPRGDARRRLLRIPESLDVVLVAVERNGAAVVRSLERVKVTAAELRRLAEELGSAEGPGVAWAGRHRVADVRLVELGPIATQLGRAHAALDALDTSLGDASLGLLLDWMRSERTAVARADQIVGGAYRFFELLRSVHATTLTTGGGRITVGGAMHALRSLARRTVQGDLQTPILDRLGPVIADVCIGEPIPLDGLLLVLERIPSQRIVIALGAAVREEDWCTRDEGSFACWSLRIVQALREATDVGGEEIRVDGARLTQTLAALGDDYRRRSEWRWYFHLTIGLGNMVSYLPRDAAAERTEADVRLVPTVTEQIGIGYASPSIGEDVLAFRFGFFGSGILYRVVLDSEESDAVMFGLFAAADLYELLEIYVAPAILVHPPNGEDSREPSWGLSFGAQVPLGDYLARL